MSKTTILVVATIFALTVIHGLEGVPQDETYASVGEAAFDAATEKVPQTAEKSAAEEDKAVRDMIIGDHSAPERAWLEDDASVHRFAGADSASDHLREIETQSTSEAEEEDAEADE